MIAARFRREARLEFFDSVAYYETAQTGLGGRFRQSVRVKVGLATSFSSAGPPHNQGTRRVFSKKLSLQLSIWWTKTRS
jgi:hypothetical protein